MFDRSQHMKEWHREHPEANNLEPPPLGNERALAHGHARRGQPWSRTYHTWASMVWRCKPGLKPHPARVRYADAGVRVCARWLTFANFLADMGERPEGLTLDRIDPYGNYEPGNCRWADNITQRHNRRAHDG